MIVPCPCGGAIGTNKVQFSRSRRAEEAEDAVVAVAVSSTGPKTQTTLQLHCQKRYTGKHMKEDEHCAGLGWLLGLCVHRLPLSPPRPVWMDAWAQQN